MQFAIAAAMGHTAPGINSESYLVFHNIVYSIEKIDGFRGRFTP